MLKTIFVYCGLIQALTISTPAAAGGDVFNANPEPSPVQPQFGSDPAACNDDGIPRIEQKSGTSARVFPPVVSGTKEGAFGRWLETNGYVYHTGVCVGQPGALVLFVYDARVDAANRAAHEYFSASGAPDSSRESFPSGGGYNRKSPEQRQPEPYGDYQSYGFEAAAGRCATVFRQQGSFDGFPSCGNAGLVGWCRQFQQKNPGCVAIVAQAQTLQGGVSSDSSGPGYPGAPYGDPVYVGGSEKQTSAVPYRSGISDGHRPRSQKQKGSLNTTQKRKTASNIYPIHFRAGSFGVVVGVDNNAPIGKPGYANLELESGSQSPWRKTYGYLKRQRTGNMRGIYVVEGIFDGKRWIAIHQEISF